MSIEFRKIPDAPWFPLEFYKRELSYEEWDCALSTRMALRWTYDKLKEKGVYEDKHYDEPLTELGPSETLEDYAASLFDDLVTADGGLGIGFKSEEPRKPRWPVAGVNIFEAFYVTSMWEQNEHLKWREFARLAASDPTKALRRLPEVWRELEQLPDVLREPKDEVDGSFQAELMSWRVPLSVDITLDDETLKFAFEVWLAGIRDALKRETPKPVSDSDIENWRRYAILPAFDLSLWSEIKELKYTHTFIANHIYVDENSYNINVSDRYRQRTRPLAEDVFTWWFIERFSTQVKLHQFMVEMAREIDPEKFDKSFGPKGPPL